MSERGRSASLQGPKAESALGPRKTMLVVVIVVGCFAVLWPKVFYPMLVGSASEHIKPSPIDKAAGCCDVISETDVNTIKIMSELCGAIAGSEQPPLAGQQLVQRCRREILETCGIDVAVVLQDRVRLGRHVKRILDELRSLNGSLCLKYNYGLAPWRLGVPHRITVKLDGATQIRQERPHHLRAELVHPAFRERGRAIPQPQVAAPARPPPRVVEGRPGPIPGMRPTIGGAGHVVPPSKQGTSSMSVIMPIYTIGIVIFFTYTLMRIIFKKQPEGVGSSLYPPIDPDPHFRKEVFESEASRLGARYGRDNISSKLVVNAMSALLDEVDQELEARRKSNEVATQDLVNGTLSNGDVVKRQEAEEQPTVKVLGMEMTASCEGGKKWSRPESPVLVSPPPPVEPLPPPQEIFLEGSLPPQSHLLVADSATEPQPSGGEDPAVVLSGKMTLSVVSLEGENGAEEVKPAELAPSEEPEYEIEEYELHDLIVKRFEPPPASKIQVEEIEKEHLQSAIITEQVDSVIQAPLIHLESEETTHTVEVEEVEKEVDHLIQEAVECVEKQQPIVEVQPTLQGLSEDQLAKLEELASKANIETDNVVEIVEVVEKKPGDEEVNKGGLEESKTEVAVDLNKVEEQLKVAVEELVGKDDKQGDITTDVTESSSLDKTEVAFEEMQKSIEEKIESEPVVEESKLADEIVEAVEKTQSAKVESEQSKVINEEIKVNGSKREIEISEKIDKTETNRQEASQSKPIEISPVGEKSEQMAVSAVAEKTEEKPKVIKEKESQAKPEQTTEIVTEEEEEEEELGSDEELVEEIEEIMYEEESEEEEEGEEESEEEIVRITNMAGSESAQRVNGERSEDLAEESKYTTVSGNTAAENDISDEELTDNEEVEDEEEIIEVEEEVEEDEYVAEEGNDVNHVSGESEPEL